GSGAVTAGRPKGQRTATRRNARGRRPSWRSTIATSSIARQGTVGAAPGADPLHDEEALPRLDEREPPRLERERGRARRSRDALLELALLGLEPVDLPTAAHERVPRVHVRPERPEVEERAQDDRAHSSSTFAHSGISHGVTPHSSAICWSAKRWCVSPKIGRRGRRRATADAVPPVNVGTAIAFAPSASARSQAALDIARPIEGSSLASGSWCR